MTNTKNKLVSAYIIKRYAFEFGYIMGSMGALALSDIINDFALEAMKRANGHREGTKRKYINHDDVVKAVGLGK